VFTNDDRAEVRKIGSDDDSDSAYFILTFDHHRHHIFVSSAVVTRNSLHRNKNTQNLKTVNK